MSTPKHTPEPWMVINAGIGKFAGHDCRDIKILGPNFIPSRIGQAVNDLRLIKAAPKLYHLLAEISTAAIREYNETDTLPPSGIQRLLDEIGTTLDAIDGEEAAHG